MVCSGDENKAGTQVMSWLGQGEMGKNRLSTDGEGACAEESGCYSKGAGEGGGSLKCSKKGIREAHPGVSCLSER